MGPCRRGSADPQDVTLVGNDTGGALVQLLMCHRDARVGRVVLASCDTGAPRPWFDHMSGALPPGEAAADVLWLATLPAGARAPYGELVRHRKVLPLTPTAWGRQPHGNQHENHCPGAGLEVRRLTRPLSRRLAGG
jgi:pimeloyl-ACP methyl ester carboxylesterase